MTIHVTETQKLVAEAALAAVGADHLAENPEAVDQVIRAILVIQKGGMKSYMLNGFKRSCMSRNRRHPLEVARDNAVLDESVEQFHGQIAYSNTKAARRIRYNRARMIKELNYADPEWKREQLLLLREGRFFLNVANEDQLPNPQWWDGDDIDAA
jgi:hypothetical protein